MQNVETLTLQQQQHADKSSPGCQECLSGSLQIGTSHYTPILTLQPDGSSAGRRSRQHKSSSRRGERGGEDKRQRHSWRRESGGRERAVLTGETKHRQPATFIGGIKEQTGQWEVSSTGPRTFFNTHTGFKSISQADASV